MIILRKIDYAAQIARQYVGCPYVYASTGQKCTPSLRRNRADAKPAYAEAIYKNCPVLSSGRSSCDGCKYKDKRAFDCRGLTYIVCKEAGMSISSIGATSQYKANDWIEKGTIDKMPANTPCCVFKQDKNDKNVMQHTGFCLGDGNTVDCRGHATGTVLKPTNSYPWTHYAIPKGAFDDIDAPAPAPTTGNGTRATVRKGSKGDDVTALQTALLSLGYPLPKYGADGDFGSETLAALKTFQENHGLTVDGVCGPATWAKLDALVNDDAPDKPDPDQVRYTVTIRGVDAATATYLLESYPGATAVEFE